MATERRPEPSSSSPGAGRPEADQLIIRIREHGRSIFNLDVPASAIGHLSSLLPEALREVLSQGGLDLEAIEARYREGPFYPGPVLAYPLPDSERELLLYFSSSDPAPEVGNPAFRIL